MDEVRNLIQKEKERQDKVINLIASENYVSEKVKEAVGSIFINKYAEGYPKKRYYGGNSIVDELETLCQERALKLFNLSNADWTVNVQALSGSPANLAVYQAILPKEGKIMGLSLSHGGHLSHGHSVSITGKLWKQISYELSSETEEFDCEHIKELAIKEKPDVIVVGYTAYSRIIDWQKWRDIADTCGAHLHVDMSHIAGLVAGGVYPSPFSYADTVMTTTHKTLRGPRGALIFSKNDERKLPEKINKAVFPGLQGGPHMHTIAGIAVALEEATSDTFRNYAVQTIKNAQTLSIKLQNLGWRIVSGGTDTHLFLVDTFSQGVTGTTASESLEREGIIVNKNTIPFDTGTPQNPSGIRIGTGAETTRGKTEKDMEGIAIRIDSILRKVQ